MWLIGMMGWDETTVGTVPAEVGAAAGGGAVLDSANREVIGESGKVVWLNTRSSTLTTLQGVTYGRSLYDVVGEVVGI